MNVLVIVVLVIVFLVKVRSVAGVNLTYVLPQDRGLGICAINLHSWEAQDPFKTSLLHSEF